MKDLETLKKQAEMVELKLFIYTNELGDQEAVKRLENELKTLNDQILKLMVWEQEMQRFEAFLA